MTNLNKVFNNENNIYYGHGIGGHNGIDVVNSIYDKGLRCSHGSLYFTSVSLCEGKKVSKEVKTLLNNWPHQESRKIIIVSLPKKYNILESSDLKTYGKENSAYYYNGENGEYVRPEFIQGYYDADTKKFEKNPNYYQYLSQEDKKQLFDKVRDKYIETLENGVGLLNYNDAVSHLEHYGVPEDVMERYSTNKQNAINNLVKEEMEKVKKEVPKQGNTPTKISIDSNEMTSYTNPSTMKESVELPSGKTISCEQYLKEVVFPSMPKSGVVILKNKAVIPVKQFIEEAVMGECLEKYNGDFPRYMAENTRNNIGVITVGNEDILSTDIVDHVNEEVLNNSIILPNGEKISSKEYIQDKYSPHIPSNGMVTLKNNVQIPANQYIEEVLLSEEIQEKYNGDIGKILFYTTKGNDGMVNIDKENMKDYLSSVKEQAKDYEQQNGISLKNTEKKEINVSRNRSNF